MSAKVEKILDSAKKEWWNNSMLNHEARLQWWREARFGCFIHWGVYSELASEWNGEPIAGYGEHIQRICKINQADYKTFAIDKFNPVDFNAEEWIKAISKAGMKYFIITAKHHDGFAMYDSKISDYNLVKQTPFAKDPMVELQKACKKHGIKFGFYYSHAFDWGEKDGPGNDWEYQNPGGDRELYTKSEKNTVSNDINNENYGIGEWWNYRLDILERVSKNYVDKKSIPQIRELIRKYNPDILWFDTPHKLPFSENVRILQAIREESCDIVVNGRLAGAENCNLGDYINTGDRALEFFMNGGDWEAIPTTNESYGYNKHDHSHKSPELFIKMISKASSRNGNLLMNIGPMGNGKFAPDDADIIARIGEWLEINGEAVYNTTGSPLPLQQWGCITAKKNRLYLHVFEWPSDGQLIVGGLKSVPQKAYLLKDKQKNMLNTSKINESDLKIKLPGTRDEAVSIIVLDITELEVDNLARLLSSEQENHLLTFDAEQHGKPLSFGDGKINRNFLYNWRDSSQWLSWNVKVNTPTTFEIELSYCADISNSGDTLLVKTKDVKIEKPVIISKNINIPQKDIIGRTSLEEGENIIELHAASIKNKEFIRLLEIKLTPIKK